MMMNNQNTKLSRNRKRRIERSIKKAHKMKTSINKIKTEKKKKKKNIDQFFDKIIRN